MLVILLFLCARLWAEPTEVPAYIKDLLHTNQDLLLKVYGDDAFIEFEGTNLPRKYQPQNNPWFQVKTYWVSEDKIDGYVGDNLSAKLKRKGWVPKETLKPDLFEEMLFPELAAEFTLQTGLVFKSPMDNFHIPERITAARSKLIKRRCNYHALAD